MRSVPFFTSSRAPARSETSTPTASNILSISAHLMSDGVGLVKTRSKVRRCFLLIHTDGTTIQYHLCKQLRQCSTVFPLIMKFGQKERSVPASRRPIASLHHYGQVGLIQRLPGSRLDARWQQVVVSSVNVLLVSSLADIYGTLPTKMEGHGGIEMKLRPLLYLLARLLGDANAVRRGRIGQRIVRRVAGKATGRAMRKMLR